MSKSVERGVVKELEDGVCLLVYDVSYPPKGCDVKKFRPWFSWYDWATSKLRKMGYPLQYSVVIIPEDKIPDVEKAVAEIEEKRRKVAEALNVHIPRANVSVIRFQLKTKEDAEALLAIIREGLKAVIRAFVEDIERQLREGRDRTKLQKRVREFVRKIKSQDFLNLCIKDAELRNLMLQIEILTA